MNILIPMAGEGKRFSDVGYKIHKPILPVVYHKTGKEYPMAVCATFDALCASEKNYNLLYVDRDFHKDDRVEEEIQKHFPSAKFITTTHLTQGQASTCLLAKDEINSKEELLIASCDNGMIYTAEKFLAQKDKADAMVFTFRNNEAVLENPNAYGWMVTDSDENVLRTSIKKAISDTPKNDHAVVGTFWFKSGELFVVATEKMIKENDRINNEFYVDQVMAHILDLGGRVKVFELEQYLCWGTPEEYEKYMKTYQYWHEFYNGNDYIGNRSEL
ncbi:nucleotidyltransferase [Lachnospiraceae bacterium ZAX-1]